MVVTLSLMLYTFIRVYIYICVRTRTCVHLHKPSAGCDAKSIFNQSTARLSRPCCNGYRGRKWTR